MLVIADKLCASRIYNNIGSFLLSSVKYCKATSRTICQFENKCASMALKGIKVIELAGLAPVPFCGMILADFGASVIRIDRVGGDISLDCLSNGKKSVAVNLKHKSGVEILKKLCRTSDVLIEPYRCGVMESLGLGPEILLKENPRLIYARLTGFGQSGPYSKKAGHDINYISISGVLSFFGRYKERPIFPVNVAADFGGGGLICALGIITALFERHSSGLGQVVDSNMVEGSAYLGSWLFRSQELPVWGNERGKNLLDTGAHFYEVYETKDGKYMSVGALEPAFYSDLLKGLGLDYDQAPHLGDFDKSKELLTNIFKTKSQAEWCAVFDQLDACVTPVLTLEEVSENEHNRSQGSFVSGVYGDTVPRPAPRLSRTPGQTMATQIRAERGEHTAEVLSSLNYSETDMAQLSKEGAIEILCKRSKL